MAIASSQVIEDFIIGKIPITSHKLYSKLGERGIKPKPVQKVIKKMVKDGKVKKRGFLKDMRSYTLVGA